MNYKVKKTLKDNKKSIIIIGVLWIILTIILVSPIAYSIVEATNNGIFNLTIFLEKVFANIVSFNSITKVFTAECIGTFFKTLLYFTIFYNIFFIIVLFC